MNRSTNNAQDDFSQLQTGFPENFYAEPQPNDNEADDENYPDVYYADTIMSWILFLITVPFSIYPLFIWPLMAVGLVELPPMEPPGKESAMFFARSLAGVILLPLTISVAMDLWIMRLPVIRIYREGIIVRSFKKQKEFSFWVLIFGGEILLVFIAFWRLITLRAFRVKTYHFRWEELEPNWVTVRGFEINKKGKLSSVLPPNTYFTKDDYSIFFEKGFLVWPTHAVGNIINIFGEEPHQRAKLGSWNG